MIRTHAVSLHLRLTAGIVDSTPVQLSTEPCVQVQLFDQEQLQNLSKDFSVLKTENAELRRCEP